MAIPTCLIGRWVSTQQNPCTIYDGNSEQVYRIHNSGPEAGKVECTRSDKATGGDKTVTYTLKSGEYIDVEGSSIKIKSDHGSGASGTYN